MLYSAQYKARTWLIILFTAAAVAVAACKPKEEEASTEDAPSLPPMSAFVVDFDEFPSATSPREIASPVTVNTTSNFGFAAVNVAVWNTLIKVGLAVPVAAFVESFNHVPARQSDGTWVWSYDVRVGGVKHTAELHGKISDGNVHWDMYISKEGFYSNFNWYSGESDLARTHGTWTLQNNPDDPTPLLGIEWNYNAQADTGDIKYTNIVPNGPENGGYIHYGITADPSYEAFYDIYNKGQNDLVEIEWNRTSHAGRVKNLKNFGNEDWHYWDSALQDTVAP